MGAGDEEAGMGDAGHDTPVDDEFVIATKPQAILFDPATRTFPQTTDGENVSIHPVDQQVAIILGVYTSSLRASVPTGIDRDRIRKAPRVALGAVINDEVRSKLAKLIADGDVELLGTPFQPNANGRPIFFVDYVNLRLPPTEPLRRIPAFA
jgi:hypothetical protein